MREAVPKAPPGPPIAVAILPGERAGMICTVSAGSVAVDATLRARPGDALSLPLLPDPAPSAHYHAVREDREGGVLRISCEARATRPDDLAAAVDDFLRALSAHAACAEAVLKARAVRLCEPLVPGAILVGELARDLRRRRAPGVAVSFGPSWTPAPGGAVCVGAQGREREIERLLRESPAWQPVPL